MQIGLTSAHCSNCPASQTSLPDALYTPRSQVHRILRLWRYQSNQGRSGGRRPSQQDLAARSAHNSQSNCSRAKRSLIVSCAASPLEDRRLCAGIPVSSANTTVGHSLWQTLQHKPLEFVPAVQSCLHDVALEAPSTGAQDAEPQSILASTRRRALLEDVLYLWAVAEAYLADAALQASFRAALGRDGTALLAAGNDGIQLLSKVKLLDGQEGQYMIGSVEFAKPGQAETQLEIDPGVLSHPALTAVLGSDRGKALLESQGKLPSRMSREGAARTYHMYTFWGYFNRRMSARRQLEQQAMPGFEGSSGIAFNFGESSKQQTSTYGKTSNIWRYFENVPDAITELRTKEAAEVADRHLRALFGDQEECITTLLAWQQMLTEARWFGRALYDAEDIVLQSCAHHLTQA